MNTEWLCAILIIVLLIIGWIWAFKDEDITYPRLPIMYLLTIIGIGIIGSLFWN